MLAGIVSVVLALSSSAFAANYNYLEVINPDALDSDDWVEDAKQIIGQCDDQDEDQERQDYMSREPQEALPEAQLEMIQWHGGGRLWTCFARTRGGRTFSGQSRSQAAARRIAFNRCISRSNGCFSRGCR